VLQLCNITIRLIYRPTAPAEPRFQCLESSMSLWIFAGIVLSQFSCWEVIEIPWITEVKVSVDW
jgi:hypothetical protein